MSVNPQPLTLSEKNAKMSVAFPLRITDIFFGTVVAVDIRVQQ